MSRHSPGRSYGHAIQRLGPDDFRLSWVVDFYYQGSRLRHPRRFNRDTDEKGACRFRLRWNLAWSIP
jgi:hypothetical protein